MPLPEFVCIDYQCDVCGCERSEDREVVDDGDLVVMVEQIPDNWTLNDNDELLCRDCAAIQSPRIFRYKIPQSDEVTVQMPAGARILKIAGQIDSIYLWALVEPANPNVDRHFYLFDCNESVDVPAENYVGTAVLFDGRLTLHVFEQGLSVG